MTKAEIRTFIEEMKGIGDDWTEEQVKRCYSDCTLEEALCARRKELGIFFDIIGKFINR